jgi:hypothetical protein
MNLAPECQLDWLGFATFVALVSLPIAMLITWSTILLYRRAVARAMQRGASSGSESLPARSVTTQLAIEIVEPRHESDALAMRASAAMRRLSFVYVGAGCAHAAVVTALQMGFGGIEFLPLRTLALWTIYAWPVVPVIALIAVGQRRAKAMLIAGYFVALAIFDALLTITGRIEGGFGQILLLWLLEMGPPTLLLLCLSNRAWRCVGLIAFLFTLTITLAWAGSFQLLGCAVLTTRSPLLLDWMFAIQMAIVIATFLLAWQMLRWIVRRYTAKRISDQSLTLDSWWLLITFIEMLLLAPGLREFTPLLLGAFAVYKLLVCLGLRQPESMAAKPLLLLRVFGHAKRSERLLDEVGQRWRYAGPINLIAGTDLASSNLEPNELIQFWSGRLNDAFIASPEDLEGRLRDLDFKPDHDGRYRVNEFFCHADTWQATVCALVERCSAVLMDLRGFTRANLGCQFELSLLLAMAPLKKLRMLVDQTTDLGTLKELLFALWRKHGRDDALPKLELIRVETGSSAVAQEVFAAAS